MTRKGFVFADVIGFHTLAMTVDGEREPKAATALASGLPQRGRSHRGPSIGEASAAAIARELGHYLDCYGGASGERPDLLAIQAWRAGDGLTVARALGQTLVARGLNEDDEASSPLCFTLDLFHALALVGRGTVLVECRSASPRWRTSARPTRSVVSRHGFPAGGCLGSTAAVGQT